MSRVKFNVNAEYAYRENFKILSNTFHKHHVDRPIPVEQLVKCKMQDNLEFLQWTKRYWDQYYPGGDYDALARRKGAGATPALPPGRTTANAGAARRPMTGAGAAAPRASSRQMGGAGPTNSVLQQKNAELMETVQGLERERDFYFSKLRDIELLIQQAIDADPTLDEDENSLLKQIQAILYSTEVSGARFSPPVSPRPNANNLAGGIRDSPRCRGRSRRRGRDFLDDTKLYLLLPGHLCTGCPVRWSGMA